MLQIISQLAITCKNQKVTEDWYCRNFGFRRARVAKLPDGKEIIFIKMADSSFYLESDGRMMSLFIDRNGLQPVLGGYRHPELG